jgi:hypothetical protein
MDEQSPVTGAIENIDFPLVLNVEFNVPISTDRDYAGRDWKN